MTDSSTVLGTLREDLHAIDLVAVGSVALVLLALFALPEPLKRRLAFYYVEPTVFTAITAHFVHLTVDHLLANLAGLLVLGSTGYALAVLGGRRRLFAVLLTTALLVFPPVLSALNLAVPRDALMYGFSGVNMALAGLLPLVLTEYAGRRLHGAITARFAPGLFFLIMAFVSVIAIPTRPLTIAVAALSFGVALVYGWQLWRALGSDAHSAVPRGVQNHGGWVEFGVFGAVIALGYPLVGYPVDPAGAGQVANIYVHTLGYALAFIGGYVGFELGLFD